MTTHLKPAVYYVLFHSILAFLLKINLMFTPLSIFLFNRSLFNTLRGVLLLDVKPGYLRIFYKHIHYTADCPKSDDLVN